VDERILTDVFGARHVADDGEPDGAASPEVSLGQSPRGLPAPLAHAFDQLGIGFIHRRSLQDTPGAQSVEDLRSLAELLTPRHFPRSAP
jgi:hypothetical protein